MPRGENFDYKERQCLIDLIGNKYKIIECKKCDAASTYAKNKAWEEVTNQFNVNSRRIVRTAAQLRKLWKNMKTKAKNDAAGKKKELRKTGK